MIIDEQIVSLIFNNSGFQKGVAESSSTLDKFQAQIDHSTKGMSSVFDGAVVGLQSFSKQFSALELIAVGALTNIGRKLEDTISRYVKGATIDQVTAGWSKYESKTSSVQTIMAAGYSMDQVSKALDTLNQYADETSYSFMDMVNNIGKFTAQGIDLETAAKAMEGISNWAAVSGAGISGASRAMYNLSQSIGMGAVKLQDWKSIENANMATKEFKETAMETAVAVGTLLKINGKYFTKNKYGKAATQVTAANFSQTLSEGWFDKATLLQTLQLYSDAADVALEYSNVMGGTVANAIDALSTSEGKKAYASTYAALHDLTESQALDELNKKVTEFSIKVFRAAQEAKTFTEAWEATKEGVSTAWSGIFESIFGNYEEAKSLWSDVAELFYNAFVAPVQEIGEVFREWHDLGGREGLFEDIYKGFEAMGKVLEPLSEAFDNLIPDLTLDSLKDFTDGLGRSIVKIMSFGRVSKKISEDGGYTELGGSPAAIEAAASGINFLSTVFTAFQDAVTKLKWPFMKLKEEFKDFLDNVANRLKKAFDYMSENGTAGKVFDFLSDVLYKGLDILSKVVKYINENVFPLIDGLTSSIDLSWIGELASGLNTLWEALKKILGLAWGTLVSFIKSFDLSSLFTGNNFLNMDVLDATSFGIFAVILKKIFDVFKDGKSLTKTIEDLGSSIGGFFDALTSKVSGGSGFSQIAQDIKVLGEGLLFVIGAMLVFTLIDEQKAGSAMIAVGMIIGGLIGAAKLLEINKPTIKGAASSVAGGTAIAAIASALLIVAGAMLVLAFIPEEKIDRGLSVMTQTVIEFGLLAVALQKFSGGKALLASLGLIAVAGSILIIAAAFGALALINPDRLDTAVGILTLLLFELGTFMAAMSVAGLNGLLAGGGLLLMAAGLLLVAGALGVLSLIDGQQLLFAIEGMAAALGLMTVFGYLASGGLMIAAGAGLLVMSAGLLVAAAAFAVFGALPLDFIFGAIVKIALSAVVLGAVAAGLSGIAAEMVTAAGGIALMGASLIVLGLGLAAVGLGGGIFISFLKATWELIKDIIRTIADLFLGIIEAVTGWIPFIGDDISNGISDLKAGIDHALANDPNTLIQFNQSGQQLGDAFASGMTQSSGDIISEILGDTDLDKDLKQTLVFDADISKAEEALKEFNNNYTFDGIGDPLSYYGASISNMMNSATAGKNGQMAEDNSISMMNSNNANYYNTINVYESKDATATGNAVVSAITDRVVRQNAVWGSNETNRNIRTALAGR